MALTKANIEMTIMTIRTVTTTDSMVNGDGLVLLDTSGGTFVFTIQAASSSNKNRIYRLKKITSDFNPITISDGAGFSTTIDTNGEELEIYNDGSSPWQALARNGIAGAPISTATQIITGASSNPTKGTASIDTVFRWRVGRRMWTQYSYAQTGAGSNGSGTYFFNPPSPLTVDISYVSTAGLATQPSGCVGSGSMGSANPAIMYVGVSTAGNVFFMDGSTQQAGSSNNGLGGASVQYTATWCVPISGWNDV